jgi:predicted glycoside hydrolase/deacetylase ChbG (UPF0249 family)
VPTLIVNADDLGRSAGINRGILEAYRRGIVTSTSVMINYPDAAAGLEEARRTAPDLGVGLHLNLTSGVPVLPPARVPSLVDEQGRFFGPERIAPVYLRFNADEVRRELLAQVERFITLTGHPPDHLDSHHHMAFLHPDALRVTVDLARKYALPLRKPHPSASREQAAEMLRAMLPGFPPDLALDKANELVAILSEAPVPRWPDYLETRFYDENAILGELLLILVNLPEGVTELMCHPGYAEGLSSPYAAQRERELEALTHPSVREVIVSRNIRLVSFKELTG